MSLPITHMQPQLRNKHCSKVQVCVRSNVMVATPEFLHARDYVVLH